MTYANEKISFKNKPIYSNWFTLNAPSIFMHVLMSFAFVYIFIVVVSFIFIYRANYA